MLAITFDIRSEMAGPVVLPLEGTPPFSVVQITDLQGAAADRRIGSDRVLVRLLAERLMVSLRDLGELNIQPDEYSGSLTLVDDEGQELEVPVKATCKATLWYR